MVGNGAMVTGAVGRPRAMPACTAGAAMTSASPQAPLTFAAMPGHAVRRLVPAAVCLVLYTAAAAALYGHFGSLGSSHIVGSNMGDQVQEVWFLAWPPFAISHGLNPLFSTWMNIPLGVNLSINTSMPLLGILGWPITTVFGPVATFNVLLRLAFVVSPLAMCLVLRRWTTWWPAAFLGGLTYGFATYMVGQGHGHLFLVFVPLPPVILWVLDEIVVSRRWRARTSGISLAALLIAQYLISPEVLTMTVVIGSVAVLIVALANRDRVRASLRPVGAALAWAGALCAVVLAYPLWFALAGPMHVVGPPHPLSDLALYPGDLLGTVIPDNYDRIAPQAAVRINQHLTAGNAVENGEYLGIPFVMVVAALVIIFRRRPALVFAAVMTLVAWVFSLGAHLTVDGHDTGLPLPFVLLDRVPIFQDALAVRFTLFVDLFAGATLAIGLDELHAWARARSAARARSRHVHGGGTRTVAVATSVVLPLLLAVLVAVPLLPRSSYTTAAAGVAPFFTGPSVASIPAGGVVLTYPYPIDPQLAGMLDQAASGFRFRIIGGYAAVPAPDGTSMYAPTQLLPTSVQSLFLVGLNGPGRVVPAPPTGPAMRNDLRSFLVRYRVATVIFHPAGRDPKLVVAVLTSVLGRPTHDGGVIGWFDVPASLRHFAATGGGP